MTIFHQALTDSVGLDVLSADEKKNLTVKTTYTDVLYRCAVQMCCMRNSARIFTFICVNKPEISSSVDEFSFKMKIVKVTRKLL